MTRRRRSVRSGLAIAAVVTLGVLGAAPAWATGPIIGQNQPAARTGAVRAGVVLPHGLPGYAPGASLHDFGPSYPFGYHYAGPSYPFGRNSTQPAHPLNRVARPVPPPVAAPRWVQGHWAQQWMPQYYTYDAWVPGYFARNGAWVQGYYETRTAESGGYYQQVWVDGYWCE